MHLLIEKDLYIFKKKLEIREWLDRQIKIINTFEQVC